MKKRKKVELKIWFYKKTGRFRNYKIIPKPISRENYETMLLKWKGIVQDLSSRTFPERFTSWLDYYQRVIKYPCGFCYEFVCGLDKCPLVYCQRGTYTTNPFPKLHGILDPLYDNAEATDEMLKEALYIAKEMLDIVKTFEPFTY